MGKKKKSDDKLQIAKLALITAIISLIALLAICQQPVEVIERHGWAKAPPSKGIII